jgi:hypothetical protein
MYVIEFILTYFGYIFEKQYSVVIKGTYLGPDCLA